MNIKEMINRMFLIARLEPCFYNDGSRSFRRAGVLQAQGRCNHNTIAPIWVYDKIPAGGTKFNISVRGVVRTGAVGTLIAKRGFHDKETAIRNHTASAVPSGTKCW